MKRGRLPDWCSEYRDARGKMRVRFRRTGFKTYYFKAAPWTADFMAEYQACIDGTEAPRIAPGAARTKPGTINAVAVAYYTSTDFLNLKPSSKATTRGIIDRFRVEHGDKLVSHLERRHIKALIGAKKDTPAAANNLLIRIRTLLNVAVDNGMIRSNPAIGLKGFRIESAGFHTWTEDEIALFEARHPVGSKARLAMTLMLWTGARRGDVVKLGWQHVAGGRVKYQQSKTGRTVDIPVLPDLAKVLAGTPRTNMTFLVTRYGKPHSAKGFGAWMRERCDEAGVPECTSHGLRKAIARRLAEGGCSNAMIKSVTGHVTDKEVARYTAGADRAALADLAFEAIGRADREQTLANKPEGVAKTGSK